MSIEKQLKHEYVRASDALRCPSEVDEMVHSRWKQQNGAQPWYRARIPRRVIGVALSLMLFTGFAYSTQQLLFSEHRDGFFWEVASDSRLKLSPEVIAGVREQLEEVRQQLPVGETAYVYLPELQELLPGEGMLSISNPELESNYASWKQNLQQLGGAVLEVPEQLPGGFEFNTGMNAYAFYEGSISDFELIQSIKEEAEQSGDGLVWCLIGAGQDPLFPNYTTTYVDASGKHIYITASPFSQEAIGIKTIIPESSNYENVTVNGETAHYIVNDQSIMSPTQLAKSVSWTHEEDGKTVMYAVITDSAQVSKEQLVAAAESLN